MAHERVKVWQETVKIPTYGVGKPEKNPMFFEKRVYQGSSGVVYPNAVIEKILDIKRDESYTALFLENEYIKVMILPSLGGRIQMAYDKIGQRHFIYYNQVIKPALVGLTGPWISGGIEFNWPQHHRPSTFEPVDFKICDGVDGSKIVYVNEVERMFHTKAMAAFILHPGKAYIEIKATLYNRSALPQTFLWWANPAVKVNDAYQSVFPSDVNAVFDHGKRDVSDFPVATGTYYKVDYAPGTDISFYKNIPVPTSYMAINSAYDFVGGYEHDSQGGVLHVADHHVSPGKKQWTWGHSDFGQAWDRNLTDEDGPYIELMTGVYTDNQPDFTWIMPYESKSFSQYFLPYRDLGLIKNATRDMLISIDYQPSRLWIKLFATAEQKHLQVQLCYDEKLLLDETIAADPSSPFVKSLDFTGAYDELKVAAFVLDENGRQLLSFEPGKQQRQPLPEPAKAAMLPVEIDSLEQLFLTGQHLEQYRHATYSPVPYYEEALRRDERDFRNNNALGLWYLRHGRFDLSESYFNQAIETVTQRNPNPYDSEPYYHLGVCLEYLNKQDAAYDAYFKATWSKAWKDAGYFAVARIDMQREDYNLAIEHVQVAIDHNAAHSKAYVLLAASHRIENNFSGAQQVIHQALSRDLFNLGAAFEQVLLFKAMNHSESEAAAMNALWEISRGDERNFMEYGLDYMEAGMYEPAITFFEILVNRKKVGPMTFYYLAACHDRLGNQEQAYPYFEKAAAADPALCFPNRLQDIGILALAIRENPKDAKAPYYLGNLFYDKRQYDLAIDNWLLSCQKDPAFPTVQRNLGIAFYNKHQEPEKARVFFEKAFELDQTDARVFMEMDQLYKRLNLPVDYRLNFLNTYPSLTAQRDDTYLERINLFNLSGDYEQARQLLMDRQFHPWEGGEGKVSGQYIFSLLELAKQKLLSGAKDQIKEVVELLEAARVYPPNLGEGKLYGALENDLFYFLGCAYEKLGEPALATAAFKEAVEGDITLGNAMYYNDQQPDKLFYQGLAWRKLGHPKKAARIFTDLINHGRTHENDQVTIEYFAVSLPNLLIFEDDLDLRNHLNCLYLQGLGQLGAGDLKPAESCFKKVLEQDQTHLGAVSHLQMITHPELL